ncbi:MAG TPA: fatty acid desaturase [Gemmataceae bacterium]|nr:fatty acid desaturase [Gemmataceae bacterium]
MKTLADTEFKVKLQELRRTDNVTNWYYIARAYLYLILVIGGAVWFFGCRPDFGVPWWVNVPVALAAVLLIGAGQHQLSGLTHEGSHYVLFKNRTLNELASDVFCTFPLFSSTHLYRLQHLAHHQFVNDPDRDPDQAQMRSSGHRLPFPLAKRRFLLILLGQLWLPKLIRFTLARGKQATTGGANNPYLRPGVKPSKTAVRVGLVYFALLIPTLFLTWNAADSIWLVAVPLALWLAVTVAFARLPTHRFLSSRLTPPIHPRYTSMLRVTFITAVLVSLAWIERLTPAPATKYYLLLWVLPVFTSFAFCMMLRQVVQHGNADRGKLTNTRTFLVHRAINFAVFPIGQEYHLPHHLYVTIPHYRLKALHEVLMQYPDYREEAVVVEGYFFPKVRPPVNPTVLDVIGPAFAAKGNSAHIENEVLEVGDFQDRAAIEREGELSRGAG